MHDTILDDVDTLLLKELGDKRILEQIKRAAQNNEVISVYERNYVTKLKTQYLEKNSLSGAAPQTQYIPAQPTPQNVPFTQPSLLSTTTTTTTPSRKSKFRKILKRKNIIVGVGGIALIAILIVGISSLEVDFSRPAPITQSGTSIFVDARSYAKGDVISIYGTSDISLEGKVMLSIENSADALVWTEDVTLKPNGSFSTLTIAAGSGWDDAGTYTLLFKHDDETQSIDFTFNG